LFQLISTKKSSSNKNLNCFTSDVVFEYVLKTP
jgi:hypothetical protein